MKQTKNYFIIGLWIFALLAASILATLYAAQTDFTVLLMACSITSIILSLSLLLIILQSKKANKELESEVERLREIELIQIQKHQQSTQNNKQQTEVFNIDHILQNIIPASEMQFSNVESYSEKILQNIARGMNIVQGLLFVFNDAEEKFLIGGQYAYYAEEQPQSFVIGENISGQVAKNKQLLNLKELPEGYITIISGLGKSAPKNLIIAPIVHNNNSIGVIELASFTQFNENEEALIRKICESMANQLNELRIKV